MADTRGGMQGLDKQDDAGVFGSKIIQSREKLYSTVLISRNCDNKNVKTLRIYLLANM